MQSTMMTDRAHKPRPYPYMGRNRNAGYVVLFTGLDTGVCVWSPDDKKTKVGDTKPYYGNSWNENAYDRFHGLITLSA